MTDKDTAPEFPLDEKEKEEKATPPETTAVAEAPEDIIRLALNNRMPALKNFLGDETKALRFMSSVSHCIQQVPKLLECSKDSLMGAFMECAALGLFPGTHSGDCYVLPYKKNAQFQMGYRGFKTLAFRSGIIKCGSEIVYEKDFYEEERGTSPKIVHRPLLEGDRGKAYRAYAWAETSPGNIVFRSMSKDEIMKIKAMSKSKDSEYSPWNEKNDPQLWMWQKTVFKQLAKLLPTTEKLDRAIYLDNVSERGGYIESESSVVEVSFELDAEIQKEIDELKTLKELKEYYDAKKGIGKEFDKAIMERKKELSNNK